MKKVSVLCSVLRKNNGKYEVKSLYAETSDHDLINYTGCIKYWTKNFSSHNEIQFFIIQLIKQNNKEVRFLHYDCGAKIYDINFISLNDGEIAKYYYTMRGYEYI